VDDFFDQVDPARLAAVRYERDRIDKWIRDHLVVNPNVVGCQRCRRPIIAGDKWTEASNGEARARFHRDCHAEWRAEQETAARQALGLTLSVRPRVGRGRSSPAHRTAPH
jgi:hypothetical protein